MLPLFDPNARINGAPRTSRHPGNAELCTRRAGAGGRSHGPQSIEETGPPAGQPRRLGFGTALIRRIAKAQLYCRPHRLPLPRAVTRGAGCGGRPSTSGSVPSRAAGSRVRIQHPRHATDLAEDHPPACPVNRKRRAETVALASVTETAAAPRRRDFTLPARAGSVSPTKRSCGGGRGMPPALRPRGATRPAVRRAAPA
jgi:hypothetical protein